jgi:cysteine desulfurase
MTKSIYIDYAATTPMDPLVIEEMVKFMTSESGFGNPASIHSYGVEAAEAVENARCQVAALINAQAKELIWTSGATEANNLAIRGVAQRLAAPGHFITVKTEHKAVLDTYKALEQLGHEVTYLDVDKTGRLILSDLENALRDNTVLVSVMHVNNEIGVIQDIAKISEIVHRKNSLLHVDAVQSAGKIAIDVEAMQIDLLSLSAHKLYGPKGIGALYIRQKPRVRIEPLITGGSQERGLRAGTLATHQIVGMGTAYALATKYHEEDTQHIAALRDLLFTQLSQLEGIIRNGNAQYSAPHILNISVEGVEGEALVYGLQGVALSSGSACNSHNVEASHVLMALGIAQELAHATLRFSVGRFSTEQEILSVAQIVGDHIRHLRKLSPYNGASYAS